ncbi:MAG: AAA family ATPase, partial [Planctomycetota bacterium]
MTGTIQKYTRLRRIALSNLLSFGPDMEPLDLENLNILIGPNGAGKSNLIEAVSLMRAAPGDIRSIVRRGGGAGEWIWKGGKGSPACIDFVMDNPQQKQHLRHVLSFREDAMGFRLEDERIENETVDTGESEPYFYYRFNQGHPVVNTIKERGKSLAYETVD